jgi:hypothetical protein
MALIEMPATVHWYPHEIHFFENNPEGFDRPRKHRCMGDVKDVPFLVEGATGLCGFLDALFAERNIGPSGKAIFSIPLALTVSKKY